MRVAPLQVAPANSTAEGQTANEPREVRFANANEPESDLRLESPSPAKAAGVMAIENEPVASLPNFSDPERSQAEQGNSFTGDSFADPGPHSSFAENPGAAPIERKKRRRTVTQLRAVKRLSIQSKRDSRAGSLEQRNSLDFGRKSPEPNAPANGRETPQQGDYVNVGLKDRVIEAVKENVELPLIEGTSTKIFLLCVAGVLTLTMYYFIQLVVVAGITQYANPPGKFIISYEKVLETPSIKICPDQAGINITAVEDYGFPPLCSFNYGKPCSYVKVPDLSGDNHSNLCYIFNIPNREFKTPFNVNDTRDSITIVFGAIVNTSNPDFTYFGIPFTFIRSVDYNSTDDFPRNGYIRINSVSMVNILLRKHISITNSEKWTFYSPGLVSLKLSDSFFDIFQSLTSLPPELKSYFKVFVLNMRYASMQVTTTQEYYPYGPLEIIAALGGIVSLGLGIMQALYPKQKKIVRRFVLDVLEDVDGDEDESDSEDEHEKPAARPHLPPSSQPPPA